MIYIENIASNVISIKAPKKIKYGDFQQIAPDIDKLIEKHGSIRLLVDGREFRGWDGFNAFRQHIGFVLNHQKYVEKIAVITGYIWQRWLIGVMRVFLHPIIMPFDKKHEKEARKWIIG